MVLLKLLVVFVLLSLSLQYCTDKCSGLYWENIFLNSGAPQSDRVYVGRVRNNKENVRILPSSFHLPATTKLYIPLFPGSATFALLKRYFSEEIKISISLKKAKEDSYDIHYLREQDVFGKNKANISKVCSQCMQVCILEKFGHCNWKYNSWYPYCMAALVKDAIFWMMQWFWNKVFGCFLLSFSFLFMTFSCSFSSVGRVMWFIIQMVGEVVR